MAGKSVRSGRASWLATLAVVASTAACTPIGQYVWVGDYRDPKPPTAGPNSYVLAPGDVLQVRVYGEENMSARAKVRPDGKISLPLLNDVQAEGYTPGVLAQQLEALFEKYKNRAQVTVAVEEQRHVQIAVVGFVAKQGVIDLPLESGVLQALASAGGITEEAHPDRIFVLRNDPEPARIRFKYESLLHAITPASTFHLHNGDQVVVE